MHINQQPERIALITGASKGLGALLADFLAAQGYALVLTARGQETLEYTANALKKYGNTIIALPGDIAEAAHRTALINTVQNLGSLDLLINNASTLGPTPMPSLASYSVDDLARVFDINVIAPLALIQEAMPVFANDSLIINISSDAAQGGYPGWGGYGASKAALDLISRTLANELRDQGMSIISVDPGDMRTDMHQDAFPGEDISDRPLPEVTLPFWAWLLGQNRANINGGRYQAQAEHWEVAHETL